MNIDFIKWKVEKAGCGFSINIINGETWVDYIGFKIPVAEYDIWALKPLLLQRAIEGVNIKTNWLILLGITIKVKHIDHTYLEQFKREIHSVGEYDKAKESALKYIWEQETR